MLYVVGAGEKQSEIQTGYLEKYEARNYRIRKHFTLDPKTDEIGSSLVGLQAHFHIKKIIENPTLRDIYEILQHPERKAILPNAPHNKDSYDCFRRDNDLIEDKKRNWFQFDLDWKKTKDIDFPNDFEGRINFAIKRLGIPTTVGYVAQISSSFPLVCNNEISIRLWVLLDKERDERELQEAFRDSDTDITMCERARLHLIDYPIIDDGIDFIDPAQTVILKSGDKLDPSSLKKLKSVDLEYMPPMPGQKEKLKNRALNTPNLRAKMSERGLRYDNPYHHIKFYEDTCDTLDGRNTYFYETLKQCYRVTGTFEPFYSEWHKERDDKTFEIWQKIRGKHKKDYLDSKIKAINKEILKNTTCGNIRDTFRNERKVIIDINSEYIYEDSGRLDRELTEFSRDGGIILLKSGCGSGKTRFVLDEIYHKTNRPKRYVFITFRKSLIDQTIEKCNLKRTGFKPNHYETYGEHIEFQECHPNAGKRDQNSIASRKRRFLPKCEKLIICVDSLHYLENNGIEKPFDFVFIDEVEHVLERIYETGDALERDTIIENKNSLYLQLIKICANAKHVVLADDKASHEITGSFLDEVCTYKDKKAWLLYNNKDLICKKTVVDISEKPPGFEYRKIEDLILRENKVVALQTNRKIDGFESCIATLVKRGVGEDDIFCIDADGCKVSEALIEQYKLDEGSKSNLAIEYRKNPNKVIPWLIDKGVKLFIHSPWNGVGWDYEGEGIDAVFVKLLLLPKIDSKDIVQYMSRFRLCDLIYLKIPKSNPGEILERYKDG